jgi:hypothetical protein
MVFASAISEIKNGMVRITIRYKKKKNLFQELKGKGSRTTPLFNP